jgi:hypothetical protein
MERKYRLVSTTAPEIDERWHEDAGDVARDVGDHLGLTPAQVEGHRRAVNADPIVVLHDGARWRSRQAWRYRAPAAETAGTPREVRVYEMIRVDEAQYDH